MQRFIFSLLLVVLAIACPATFQTYASSNQAGQPTDDAQAVGRLLSYNSVSACLDTQDCGDVDGVVGPGGSIDVSDLTYLINFLYNDGPYPPCIETADMDDHLLVTVSDVMVLLRFLFRGGPVPVCPVTNPPPDPALKTGVYVELDNPVFPPNEWGVQVNLMLGNDIPIDAMTLPIKIMIDFQSPIAIDIVSVSPRMTDGFDIIGVQTNVDNANGRFLVSGMSLFEGLDPGYGTVVTLSLLSDPSTSFRDITIGWDTFPPLQDGFEVHAPLVLGTNLNPWKPDLNTYLDCRQRGNVDHLIGPGGPIDVSDLTYLVSFLFAGGPPPPSFEEGDIDGIVGPAGNIDVSDLTYLVAYLFQSGPVPPPCP